VSTEDSELLRAGGGAADIMAMKFQARGLPRVTGSLIVI